MVTPTAIDEHLAHITKAKPSNKVAVFVGATNGIGEATLYSLASLLDQPTLYIIGRSAAKFEKQKTQLQQINPSAKIVFIEAEVSLIAGVDKACEVITKAEERVDYLVMSMGYLPFNGAEYTPEGLEICMVLSYFARMRFINNLLPLLTKASAPRVLSILAGGKETKLNEEDIGLEKKGSWSMFALMNQTTTLNSLALSLLADQNRDVSFLHAYPGLVKTDIGTRQPVPKDAGVLWRISVGLWRGLVGLMMGLMAIPVAASGKRFAFQLTSERFVGGKLWRVDEFCEPCGETGQTKLVEEYLEKGWGEKVWEFTVRTWERALEK